ncbi:MAG TPA: IS200/IS605 family transposase [Blastocatellia bacterium]|nr:IS200/IS605 family transposase [Blastocatellia bacterium]
MTLSGPDQVSYCRLLRGCPILVGMHLEPLSNLSWAYRLHYYICFRAYHRHRLFGEAERAKQMAVLLQEVCSNHDYHLLQQKVYPNHVRMLVSLRPDQTVSKVVQTVRGNSSREFARCFNLKTSPWARGYLARSVGRITTQAVSRYLTSQPVHHGYASRVLPPVYRYRAEAGAVQLSAAHASFDLNHHFVFSTSYRRSVFGSRMGEAVAQYWLKVAAKHGFAIDQVSFVPDHVHLLVRAKPKQSVEDCALAQLNNSQHFVGTRYPAALIEAGINNLWAPGAYVGTCGRVTTAEVKSFLGRPD